MKRLLTVLATALVVLPAMAQKYGATPDDSLACLQNLSVYQEFYKQKNYFDAYDAWKKVIELCPTSSLNNFIRGNAILKTRINKAKDNPEALAAYIDELLNLWDLRMRYFGDKGLCMASKAKDMRIYKPAELEAALKLYEEAMEHPSMKQKTFPQLVYGYFETVCDAYKKDIRSKEDVLAAYDKAAGVLESIAATRPDDTLPLVQLQAVTRMFEPYATCEDLINIYTKKFETSADDAAFLRKSTTMLDNRGCTDAEIFFQMTEALHKLEPSAKSAYLMANMNRARKNFAEVASYLDDDVLAELTPAEQERAYLMLAEALMNLNRYQAAVGTCRKVLDLNPENGRAYIVIGMSYAAGAGDCKGDGSPIAARAPYWAAVDMFNKAKSVDASLAETVSTLVGTYAAHFPSGDDLFTYGFKEGESYAVNCWFNHTTTIRARK